MTTSEILFWGGLAVAAIGYLLLQLERRRELLQHRDSER